MTVRLAKLGGTDWNNEQLTDDDLNDTLKRGTIQLVASSTTPSTTDNTAYTQLINETIAAGKADKYAIIVINLTGDALHDPNGGDKHSGSVDIRVGENGGSISSVEEIDPFVYIDTASGEHKQVELKGMTTVYVHELTSGEKTNGLDVDVYFRKNQLSGSSTAAIGYQSYFIFTI